MPPTTQTPATVAPPSRTSAKLVGRLAEKYGVDADKLLTTLRDTVFSAGKDKNGSPKPPFSDTELAAALVLCEGYDLNPFAREIYVTRGQGGRLLVIVPIDGWSKVVNRRSDYDGCDFEYENDEKGKPVSVKCRMWIKGRKRAVEVTEYMGECWRDTDPWGSHPRRMLRHKAYIQCARLAFSLAGIMDDDEAGRIIEGETVAVRGALAGGRKPGYLPAPSAEPQLPEVKEVSHAARGGLYKDRYTAMADNQEVKPSEEGEEKADVSSAAAEPEGPEERVVPDTPPAPAVSIADLAKPSEAIERRRLWAEFAALRSKLIGPQWKKVKEMCGVETIEPSSSLDLLGLAVEAATEVLATKGARA